MLRGIDPSSKVQTVYPGEVGQQITLASFAEPWIEKHGVSHNVRITYKSVLSRWIIPKLGARPMGEITTGDLAEFLREIDKRDQPTLPAGPGRRSSGTRLHPPPARPGSRREIGRAAGPAVDAMGRPGRYGAGLRIRADDGRLRQEPQRL